MAYIGTSSADKGGIGKTTTEINLASCLASRGLDTLLIDYTHQSNATYGINVRRFKNTMYDVLKGSVPLEEILVQPYPTQLPHLWVAPSTDSLFDFADTYNYHKDPYVLARAIQPLWGKLDHIRIDVPGSALGFYPYTAYTACDIVMVTMQAGPFEIRGFKTLINVLINVKKHFNPRLTLYKVLFTQWRETNVGREVVKYFKDTYDEANMPLDFKECMNELYGISQLGLSKINPLFNTKIRLCVEFQNDQILGLPAILSANKKGAEDYNKVTDEYLRYCSIRPAGKLIVKQRDVLASGASRLHVLKKSIR